MAARMDVEGTNSTVGKLRSTITGMVEELKRPAPGLMGGERPRKRIRTDGGSAEVADDIDPDSVKGVEERAFADLRGKLNETRQRITEALAELHTLEQANGVLSLRKEELQNIINSQKEVSDNAVKTIEADKLRMVEELRKEIDEVSQEREKLKKERDASQAKLKQYTKDTDHEMKELRREVKYAQRALDAAMKDNEDVQKAKQDVALKMKSLEVEIAKAERNVAALKKEENAVKESYDKQIRTLTKALDTSKAADKAASENKWKLEAQVVSATEPLKKANAQIAALRAKVAGVDRAIRVGEQHLMGKAGARSVEEGILPEALLLYVFDCLPQKDRARIQRVSKQWRRLANAPQLWREVTLSARTLAKGIPKTPEAFAALLAHPRFREMKSLNFGSMAIVDDRMLGVAPSHIDTLDLRGCANVTDAGLAAFLQRAPRLRSLNLEGCGKITDESLRALGGSVEVLNLSKCDKVTDNALGGLQGCTKLRDVNLRRCRLVSDAGVAQLAAHHAATLKELDVGGCANVSDVSLKSLQSCVGLHGLTLSGCKNITDAGIMYLRQCADMRRLDLEGLNQVTDAGLETLQHMPRLEDVNLQGCYATDHALYYLQQSTNLKRLILRDTQITDNGLAYIQGATNLVELSLYGCQNITDSALQYVAVFHKLRVLDLYGCTWVSDQGLHHLLRCPSLRKINVQGLQNVTQAGLDYLPKHCEVMK